MNDHPSKPNSPSAPGPAPDPGPSGSFPVFDAEQLLARLVGDRAIAGEVLRMFLEDTPRQIAKVEADLASADPRTLARDLHTLKGSSATIGAEALRAKALELETALGVEGIDAVAAGLPSLVGEFERLRTVLEASGLIR